MQVRNVNRDLESTKYASLTKDERNFSSSMFTTSRVEIPVEKLTLLSSSTQGYINLIGSRQQSVPSSPYLDFNLSIYLQSHIRTLNTMMLFIEDEDVRVALLSFLNDSFAHDLKVFYEVIYNCTASEGFSSFLENRLSLTTLMSFDKDTIFKYIFEITLLGCYKLGRKIHQNSIFDDSFFAVYKTNLLKFKQTFNSDINVAVVLKKTDDVYNNIATHYMDTTLPTSEHSLHSIANTFAVTALVFYIYSVMYGDLNWFFVFFSMLFTEYFMSYVASSKRTLNNETRENYANDLKYHYFNSKRDPKLFPKFHLTREKQCLLAIDCRLEKLRGIAFQKCNLERIKEEAPVFKLDYIGSENVKCENPPLYSYEAATRLIKISKVRRNKIDDEKLEDDRNNNNNNNSFSSTVQIFKLSVAQKSKGFLVVDQSGSKAFFKLKDTEQVNFIQKTFSNENSFLTERVLYNKFGSKEGDFGIFKSIGNKNSKLYELKVFNGTRIPFYRTEKTTPVDCNNGESVRVPVWKAEKTFKK